MQFEIYTKTIGDKELELGIKIDGGSNGSLTEEPYGATNEVVSVSFDGTDISDMLQNEHLYFAFEQIAEELTK